MHLNIDTFLDLTVPSGSFYNLSSKTVEKCPVGSVSSGSTQEYSTWSPLPPGFSTSHASGNPWVAEGDYITTGKQHNNNVYALLSFSHYVTEHEQNISIEYSVSAENTEGDGLSVILDDEPLVPTIHRTFGWQWLNFKLSSGIHNIHFVFTKHKYQTDWDDYARIRRIIIKGSAIIPFSCTPCQSGTYPDSSSSSCLACPANTYSVATYPPETTPEGTSNSKKVLPVTGASKCVPCANTSTHYSLPGSSSCLPRPQCSKKDYAVGEGHCDPSSLFMKNLRMKKVPWSPCISTAEQGEQAPPIGEGEFTCTECPRFTVLGKDDGECVSCPAGTFLKMSENDTPSPSSASLHASTAASSTLLNSFLQRRREIRLSHSNAYKIVQSNSHSNSSRFANRARNPSLADCQKCPAGSVPKMVAVFSPLKGLQNALSTSCYSKDQQHCNTLSFGSSHSSSFKQLSNSAAIPTSSITSGWKALPSFHAFYSGGPFNGPVQSVLALQTVLLPQTSGILSYRVEPHLRDGSTLTVNVDDYPLKIYTHESNGKNITETITILPSEKVVTFVFSNEKVSFDSASEPVDDYVFLKDLVLTGIDPTATLSRATQKIPGESQSVSLPSNAALLTAPLYEWSGGTGCLPCPTGTYAMEGDAICTPCPPGTFASSSAEASEQCQVCPGNTIAPFPGSTSCIACGVDTQTNDKHTRCVREKCQITLPVEQQKEEEKTEEKETEQKQEQDKDKETEKEADKETEKETETPKSNAEADVISLASLNKKLSGFGPFIVDEFRTNPRAKFVFSICDPTRVQSVCKKADDAFNNYTALPSFLHTNTNNLNRKATLQRTNYEDVPPERLLSYACFVDSDENVHSLGRISQLSLLSINNSDSPHTNNKPQTGVRVKFTEGDVCTSKAINKEKTDAENISKWSMELDLLCPTSFSHNLLPPSNPFTNYSIQNTHSLSNEGGFSYKNLSSSIKTNTNTLTHSRLSQRVSHSRSSANIAEQTEFFHPAVPFESDVCSVHFVYETIEACRLCRESDWLSVEGDCTNGKKLVHRTLRPGTVCNPSRAAGAYVPSSFASTLKCGAAAAEETPDTQEAPETPAKPETPEKQTQETHNITRPTKEEILSYRTQLVKQSATLIGVCALLLLFSLASCCVFVAAYNRVRRTNRDLHVRIFENFQPEPFRPKKEPKLRVVHSLNALADPEAEQPLH